LECLSNARFKLPEAAGLGCASLDTVLAWRRPFVGEYPLTHQSPG
jgi:hypothetical protein